MKNKDNFFERLKKKGYNLSPKQSQLAKYMLNNYKKAAFQNLSRIAKDAGVSESTIVRFATFLGYSGFPEMLEDLQKIVQHELDTLDDIRNTLKGERLKNLNILETVINNHRVNLEKFIENITMDDVKDVVDIIEKSEKIIIIGQYFSGYLADYFGYTLGKIVTNVDVISNKTVDINNIILSCDENTTVIALSFPRYPKNIQDMGDYLKKRGATVIGITDSILSPLKVIANKLIVIPLNYMSFTDPCSSVLLFIQAIVMEYISRYPEDAEEKLQLFDNYVKELNIFV